MIQIPELTPELLAELGAELGGCSFEDENQIEFLRRIDSCDVQAVPGNGKTTLLVAKLALLSRTWRARDRGVCVISHTNVAREEVQKRLGNHPTAHTFLAYPHFIGTVTAFIHQFVALPYLRGAGWHVRRIDDDAFAAAAKALIPLHPTLLRTAFRRAHSVETWVGSLILADDFAAEVAPQHLNVRPSHGQPGPHTDSGRELQAIKADMVSRGIYRFSDMHALARRALRDCPHLGERLRLRFPLAILDEAQDTSGDLLELLTAIFGGGALQRLGDQNQALYGEQSTQGIAQWQPAADAIPLNTTRRFGADIATFASRLTVRRPQVIVADEERPSHRLLMTFTETTIQDVLPRYAAWIAERLGDKASAADVRAVASRHSAYRDRRGDWPKSLIDYHSAYRGGEGQGARNDSLCGAMRRLAAKHNAGQHPRDSHADIGAAIADYLDHRGFRPSDGRKLRASDVWPTLAAFSPDWPARVCGLFLTHVLRGRAAEDETVWNAFCEELATAFAELALEPPGAFCAFDGRMRPVDPITPVTSRYAVFDPVTIQLGSVHSIKGMTADALLMVETQVYRGNRSEDQIMDLASVLPHAFGLEERDFTATEAELTAATNVFVAATRPRDMLAFAVRDSAINDDLREAAMAGGWEVLRLNAT